MITTAFHRPSLVVLTHEVLAQAAQWFGRRETPAGVQRSLQAARVREMARSLQASDPGFASDLCAAADRHDQGSDLR